MNKAKSKVGNSFERFAEAVTRITGSTVAFTSALVLVILWLITGPLFNFSNAWQLVINTGTTIITFLMVFLIQKSQNKDSLAIQLKLNELLAASEKASNRMVCVEDMTEEELQVLHRYYTRMAKKAQSEPDGTASHSIEAILPKKGDSPAAKK